MSQTVTWLFRRLLLAVAIMSIAGAARGDDLPDLQKTPGVSRSGLSKAKICSTRWGKDERHVDQTMKDHVFALYGYSGYHDARCVADARGRTCEIDHLISRELGGADVVENLWPQPYGTHPWNAQLKDKLENRLHKEVCAGNLTLTAAREMIVHDWTAAYLRYYEDPR